MQVGTAFVLKLVEMMRWMVRLRVSIHVNRQRLCITGLPVRLSTVTFFQYEVEAGYVLKKRRLYYRGEKHACFAAVD